MKYIIDFVNSATRTYIDNYLTINGITVVTHFEILGNVLHVISDNPPPSDPLIEYIVLDEDYPIQLLDFDLTLVDNTTSTNFDINDDNPEEELTIE